MPLDSLYDVTPKFLGELRAWLDTQPKPVGYDLIEDEGTALTKRGVINFIGAGVTATDDAADGRTNVTIPGLSTGGGSGSFSSAVTGFSDLRGYWRLGDSSGNWLDTSGFQPSTPADMSAVNAGGLTRHATGLINSADDDGAVQWTADLPGGPEYLQAGTTPTTNILAGISNSFTVVGWVKPTASAAGSGRVGVFSAMSVVAGSPSYDSGWSLELNYPGGGGNPSVRFYRANSSGEQYSEVTGLVAGTTYFVAITYDGAYRRIYVNATLGAEDADVRSVPTTSGNLQIGHVTYYASASTHDGVMYGTIDEVAMFGGVRTGSEISTMYSAGGRTVVAGHKVLESDGSGSSDWTYVTQSNISSGYALPAVAVKTADTTLATQATPQADPHLLLAISNSATEIWFFEVFLMVVSANATMDFKAAFSVPTSCTMLWGTEAGLTPDLAAGFGGDATGSSPVALNTESGTQSFGTNAASGTQGIVVKGFIFGGGTAGNVTFKWSQNTSDAGNLTVKKGSLLRALKIAS